MEMVSKNFLNPIYRALLTLSIAGQILPYILLYVLIFSYLFLLLTYIINFNSQDVQDICRIRQDNIFYLPIFLQKNWQIEIIILPHPANILNIL